MTDSDTPNVEQQIIEAEQRLAMLDALARVLVDPRGVIDIVAEAVDRPAAEAALHEHLDLEPLHAGAVLALSFEHVTQQERDRVSEERRRLRELLAALRGVGS